MYGFQKITSKKNPDKDSYFHELFLRGRPGLSRGILRHRHKSIRDPSNEPNLCMFPPMPRNYSVSDQLNLTNPREVNNNNESQVGSCPKAVQYCSPELSKSLKMNPDEGMYLDAFNSNADVNASLCVDESKRAYLTSAPLLKGIKNNQMIFTKQDLNENTMKAI